MTKLGGELDQNWKEKGRTLTRITRATMVCGWAVYGCTYVCAKPGAWRVGWSDGGNKSIPLGALTIITYIVGR